MMKNETLDQKRQRWQAIAPVDTKKVQVVSIDESRRLFNQIYNKWRVAWTVLANR